MQEKNANSRHVLCPFEVQHGAVIASWIRDEQELFWLAPATEPPLTAAKVAGWTATRGSPFVLVERLTDVVHGYGELNPIRGDTSGYWLGHVIVDPAYRGQGLGRLLTDALIEHARSQYNATRLVLVVFPGNQPAVRCYEACGFQLIGEELHAFRKPVRRHRMLRFEMRLAGAAASVETAQRKDYRSIG